MKYSEINLNVRSLGGRYSVVNVEAEAFQGKGCGSYRLKSIRRTKAQALDTRATILDAAEEIFLTNGVAHTTSNTIADAAGVTRGAIYWHFRNEEAVFEAVLKRFELSLDPFALPVGPVDSNPLGKLQAELEARLAHALVNTRTRHLYSIVFARCGGAKTPRASADACALQIVAPSYRSSACCVLLLRASKCP